MEHVTDPVGFFIAIGWGMGLLCSAIGVRIAYECRDDIMAVVKAIVGRYFHVRWRGLNTGRTILSSSELEAFFMREPINGHIADTYQLVPDSAIPPAELVRPTAMTDDDIITWLAQLKNPGKTAYRFSANSIAEIVGGTRNEVLKKVAVHRPVTTKIAPQPVGGGRDPIVDMAPDPFAEHHTIPVRQTSDGSRYIVDANGERQPV